MYYNKDNKPFFIDEIVVKQEISYDDLFEFYKLSNIFICASKIIGADSVNRAILELNNDLYHYAPEIGNTIKKSMEYVETHEKELEEEKNKISFELLSNEKYRKYTEFIRLIMITVVPPTLKSGGNNDKFNGFSNNINKIEEMIKNENNETALILEEIRKIFYMKIKQFVNEQIGIDR